MYRKLFSLFFVLLALSLVACQGKVRGQVFVDDNANGILDFNEKGAGSIQLTVTKDGKRCASGRTLSTGEFAISACGEGTYCIHLNEDVAVSTSGGTSKQAAPSGTGVVAPSTPATPVTPVTPSPSTPTSTPQSGASSEKPALQPNCKAFVVGRDLNFEVAMAPGYVDELTQLPDISPIELKPGQEHTINVRYPCSCTLLPFYLPDQFELVVPEEDEASRVIYQPDVNRLTFSTAPLPQEQARKKKPGEVEDRSKLCVESLELRVKPELASQNATHTLRFRAKCGDGEHALQAIPLRVAAESQFELTHVMYGTPALGTSLNLDVIVSNPNGVKAQNLTLTIVIPDKVQTFGLTTDATGCNTNANPMRCTFNFEAGEQEKVFGVNALLPDRSALTAETIFRFDMRLSGIRTPIVDSTSFRLSP